MAKIAREKWKTYNNVFDQFTHRNLFKLASEGFFEDLKSTVALGKEANVFTAAKEDGSEVIVKIYRLENCNFNKMFDYIKQDPRYEGLNKKRREIIFAWTQREFRNLLKAREVIRVPTPLKCKDNIVVMELIGDVDPAPELKDAVPANPKKFFDEVIKNIKKLYKAGLVHGDLSHFNILNNNEHPVFIDFSQATTTDNAEAEDLLKRDVGNIVNFFNKRCGMKADPESIISKIRKS
ncbi:serine protein kinase RIO [Candidatus Woesearchaeota archaeon]|nr:serine protein kinase RIO [Candidatus Woesearchaeota archaeon]